MIRHPSTRSFIRFRLLRNVDLPQPEGADKRGDLPRRDIQVDVFERMEAAVIQLHVFDGKCIGHRALFPAFHHHFRNPRGTEVDEQHQRQQNDARGICLLGVKPSEACMYMCSASVLPDFVSPAIRSTVPDVYISAAVSPTMRPMARITPREYRGWPWAARCAPPCAAAPRPARSSLAVHIRHGEQRLLRRAHNQRQNHDRQRQRAGEHRVPKCSLPEKNSMPNRP